MASILLPSDRGWPALRHNSVIERGWHCKLSPSEYRAYMLTLLASPLVTVRFIHDKLYKLQLSNTNNPFHLFFLWREVIPLDGGLSTHALIWLSLTFFLRCGRMTADYPLSYLQTLRFHFESINFINKLIFYVLEKHHFIWVPVYLGYLNLLSKHDTIKIQRH